jgi:hypothetical protein
MPQPTQDVIVKDVKYRLEGLPPALGVKAMTRIMRLAAPTLAKIAEVVKSSRGARSAVDQKGLTKQQVIEAEQAKVTADVEAKIDVGIKSLQQLVEVLEDDDILYFTELFVPRTQRLDDGVWTRLDPESAFACDYGGLSLLLVEHLNFNFSSFFRDAADTWRAVNRAPVESVSRDLRTSL